MSTCKRTIEIPAAVAEYLAATMPDTGNPRAIGRWMARFHGQHDQAAAALADCISQHEAERFAELFATIAGGRFISGSDEIEKGGA